MPVFTIWALVGTLIYSHEFRSWMTLVLLSISSFILYLAFSCIDSLSKTIQIVVLAMFGFSMYFVVHYLRNGQLLSGARLGEDFANVNSIGAYMTIGVCSALYLILFNFKKIYLINTLPILVFLAIGFLTGSKTFVFCTSIILIIMLFIRLKKHKWIFLIVLILLIAAIIGVLQLPFLSTIKNRIEIMFNVLTGSGSDTSTTTRALWQYYAIVLGSQNIFTGYGSNGFNIYSGVGSYSHGNYTEVFCNFGLPGLFIFYSVPFYCIFKSVKKGSLAVFPIIFGIYLFISGFFSVNYYGKTVFLIIALSIYALPRERRARYGKISILY